MIPYVHIAAGTSAALQPLAQHLMTKTVEQDHTVTMARYYGKSAEHGWLDLANQVAEQELTLEEAHAVLMRNFIKTWDGTDMEIFYAAEERISTQFEELVSRRIDGIALSPLAIVREDIHPIAALGLGINPAFLLTEGEIGSLIGGRRADGELIEGKRYVGERALPVNPKDNMRKWSTPIGATDFAPAPHKSVSVAWAFANEVEQAQIFNCHIEAAREAVTYIADEIGWARVGDGGRDGEEKGHVGWLEFTHHTARKTSITVDGGVVRVETQDKAAAGDPDLHTHFLIPNAVFCESGRVGSLNTIALQGFIFEADLYYHSRLGTKLRDAGFEVHLDERTGAARMAAISDDACSLFSKKTNIGETLARKYTADKGEIWDDLSEDQRISRMKQATQSFDQISRDEKIHRGGKDDVANFPDWQRQAKTAGWDVPQSFQFIGPPERELTEEQRHRKAYEIGLPWLAKKLEHRSVVPHWDLRLAALRGLVETGCEGLEDIKEITTLMRREGVTQYGEKTAIVWGQEDGKRYTSITTALHESDEKEFLQLARGAARDKSGAIPAGLLRQKIEQSGMDLSDDHGKRQREVIEITGRAGRLAVAVGTAGSGKTEMLKPLAASWLEMGRDVHGASLAWRQTDDLVKAGIDQRNLKAFSVLIDTIHSGDTKLTDNSVVCIDELGLLGTRQGLELLRLRERYGFSVVGLADDKQCGSIEAGAIIDLFRRALGAEQVPEIVTTKRQQSDREKEIVKLLRDGEAATALDMKRADGTAELAFGGRQGVIKRTAALYAERVEATGKAPTISAPTNSDAHQIGEAVRVERRRLGEIGPDIHLQKATDGEREYTLRLAAGDRVRLFESTKAYLGQGTRKDGRKYAIKRSIGRNGSVVEVVTADSLGVTLKAESGLLGFVKWANMPSKGDRIKLAYGYATTIHTSQGSTADEHIFALPSGSAAVTGAAGYTASTRHRHVAYLISSEAAERIAVKESRPINDSHDITVDDKWANVAKNFVTQKKVDSALAMLEKVQSIHRGAVKVFQNAVRPDDPRHPGGPRHVGDLVQRMKLDRLMERVSQTIGRVQRAFQREGPELSR